jgi:hypothetical protein
MDKDKLIFNKSRRPIISLDIVREVIGIVKHLDF